MWTTSSDSKRNKIWIDLQQEGGLVIWNFPQRKKPSPDGFTGEFNQTLTKQKRRELFPNYSVRPILFIPDKYTRRKQNYRSLINICAKILKKYVANQMQQDLKRIMHLDQMRFTMGIQSWFNIWKKSMQYTIVIK